jgi:predicted nuclease of predicted toxin-antitoxin system
MKLWLDAQLSPSLARWMHDVFSVDAVPVCDLGLRDAGDSEIFQAARLENAVVMTKDGDFAMLLDRLGSPP